MKDRVAVIGVGCTKFGERYDRGYEELICDAVFAAYDDAGIDPTEIEAGYLGTYLPGPGGGKSATSLADALRLHGASRTTAPPARTPSATRASPWPPGCTTWCWSSGPRS